MPVLKTLQSRIRRNDDGYVLMAVLAFFIMLSATTMIFISSTTSAVHQSGENRQFTQTRQQIDIGIADALAYLNSGGATTAYTESAPRSGSSSQGDWSWYIDGMTLVVTGESAGDDRTERHDLESVEVVAAQYPESGGVPFYTPSPTAMWKHALSTSEGNSTFTGTINGGGVALYGDTLMNLEGLASPQDVSIVSYDNRAKTTAGSPPSQRDFLTMMMDNRVSTAAAESSTPAGTPFPWPGSAPSHTGQTTIALWLHMFTPDTGNVTVNAVGMNRVHAVHVERPVSAPDPIELMGGVIGTGQLQVTTNAREVFIGSSLTSRSYNLHLFAPNAECKMRPTAKPITINGAIACKKVSFTDATINYVAPHSAPQQLLTTAQIFRIR